MHLSGRHSYRQLGEWQQHTWRSYAGRSFEQKITNEQTAADFVALLDTSAATYVALLTPMQSSGWEGLSAEARKAIDIISNEFGGEQIRPLMLAGEAYRAKDSTPQFVLNEDPTRSSSAKATSRLSGPSYW
jgi:hypothetical protein